MKHQLSTKQAVAMLNRIWRLYLCYMAVALGSGLLFVIGSGVYVLLTNLTTNR